MCLSYTQQARIRSLTYRQMRFSKRKSLLGDLVRLNFSGSGVSVSVGIPGARFHIPLGGSRKPGVTVGLPGPGISHSQQLK